MSRPTALQRWLARVSGALLAVVIASAVAVMCGPPAHARKRPQLRRAIVQCPAWPWAGDVVVGADLRHVSKKVVGKKLRVTFRVLAKGILAIMEARKLGTSGGQPVWSVRGPKALGAALQAAGCTITLWENVINLGAAKKAWIAQRSTCIGTGTKNGKPVKAWRCADASVSVVTIAGYAPLVSYGGSQ